MSENDDDGLGRAPSREQIIRISQHLESRNLPHGARPTHREMEARNFKVSLASVGRALGPPKKRVAPPKVGDVAAAVARVSKRRSDNHQAAGETKRQSTNHQAAGEEPPVNAAGVGINDVNEITVAARFTELVKQENSSAHLAIEENRARMALNIIIAETMASKPGLLLLDMRGTAALVDALTVASRLSGGNALDIRYPTQAERDAADAGMAPDGREMKDITPTRTKLADDLAEFRRRREANGKGT